MRLSPWLRQTGSKILNLLTLDYLKVRRCSPGFGVLESFLQCVLLSIFGSQPGPSRRNEHPDAESSRSTDKGDGQLPRWLVGNPARQQPPKHNFKDAALDLDCGVGSLIEKTPHEAVTLRRSVARGNPRALFFSGAYPDP